jgi:flagellar biogenesis protein FliO
MGANAASLARPSPETAWVAALKNIWQWSLRSAKTRKTRRLRVCETISLGEKRFVAVIEFDHQQFLVGGAGNSLELLARVKEGTVITEPSALREARPQWDGGGLY